MKKDKEMRNKKDIYHSFVRLEKLYLQTPLEKIKT
jgi:hypothetical protein